MTESNQCTILWEDYKADAILYALLGNAVYAVPISYVVRKTPQLSSYNIWSYVLPFSLTVFLQISTSVASFTAKDRCMMIAEMDEEDANLVTLRAGFSLVIQGINLVFWLFVVIALSCRRDVTDALPQDITLFSLQWKLLGELNKWRWRRSFFRVLMYACWLVVGVSTDISPDNGVEDYVTPVNGLLLVTICGSIAIRCFVLDAKRRYRLLRYAVLDGMGFLANMSVGNYAIAVFVYLVDGIHGGWMVFMADDRTPIMQWEEVNQDLQMQVV